MEVNKLAKKVFDGINSFADNVQWNGKSILRGNDAINPIKGMGKFVLGETDTGIRGTLNAMSGGTGWKKAISDAYHVGEGEARKLNYKAIAGTYVGASLAGRVATGGGLYRDSTGNVNAPGIPFI
jgi:hypothetical protein